ncbi:MAG TPA: hypothetical protein VFJ13_03605, partial [Paracoccaceae bacterium]|nr:hypothetical protein [Paracoccaceae bacterium]
MNRGVVSRLALARVDLERIGLSAEEQTNWMPRTLGSMMLRPGLGYLGSARGDAAAKIVPFVFAADDVALVEVTDSILRVWVDDAPVRRAAVSSAVANGTFGSAITSWTDADESGAASAWATGGYLSLTGTGFNAAIVRQQVTVATADRNTEHALRIVVERGPVTLRVGSTAGDDDYIRQTGLGAGTHSLAFTPAGDFHIQFSNRAARAALVDSVSVEGAGRLELPVPWTADDLGLLRWAQSADVIFVACDGHQQRRIERRGVRSWSIVLYQPLDGPF